MKKTLILFISLSLFGKFSFAQETNDAIDTNEVSAYKTNYLNAFPAFNTSVMRGLLPEKMMSVNAYYTYASSHINNGFATDFYLRKKIDAEKMNRTSDNATGINSTGIES